jgi:hypothetical protein
MVSLLNPSTMAESDTAGRGIAEQKGRTGMNHRMNRRTATITIVSTLLLALLATAGVARVFSLAPLARQEQTTRQDLNGDAGVAAVSPAGAATSRSMARDALGDTTVAGLRESLDGEQFAGTTHAVRGTTETGQQEFFAGDRATSSLASVRPDTGVGLVEYLPGEKDANSLPSFTPSREAAPEFGPHP